MSQTRQNVADRESLNDSLEAVKARLAAPEYQHKRIAPCAPVEAGVLVPLFEDSSGDVHVVLTQRSAKMTRHAGEVALPGGKRDANDVDIRATALREAHEEVGLPPEDATIIARFPPRLSLHCLSVTPLVATITEARFRRLRGAPAEVAAVFSMPLRHFLEAHPRHTAHEQRWGAHAYRIHHFAWRDWDVWGLTAGILISVAEAAFGRRAAFDVAAGGDEYAHLYSRDGKEVSLKRRSQRLRARR